MLIPNTQQYPPKKHTNLSDVTNFLPSNLLLSGFAAVLSVQVGLGMLLIHQIFWYSLLVTD